MPRLCQIRAAPALEPVSLKDENSNALILKVRYAGGLHGRAPDRQAAVDYDGPGPVIKGSRATPVGASHRRPRQTLRCRAAIVCLRRRSAPRVGRQGRGGIRCCYQSTRRHEVAKLTSPRLSAPATALPRLDTFRGQGKRHRTPLHILSPSIPRLTHAVSSRCVGWDLPVLLHYLEPSSQRFAPLRTVA